MKKSIIILSITIIITMIFTACGGQTSGGNQSNNEETKTSTTSKVISKDIEIVDSGYNVSKDGEFINWAAKIKNPDDKAIYEFTKIIVTAYDKDGGVLANEEQTMGIIMPGETQAFATSLSTNGAKPEKVEFSVESGDSIVAADDYIKTNEFEFINVKDKTDEYDDTRFTGKIKNNSTKDCEQVAITVLFKKGDKIICGTTSYVESVKAGQEKAFDFSEYNVPEYDSYEIFAYDWSM